MLTVNPAETSGNPFFDRWLQGWSRKIEISKSLAGIRGDMVDSARRLASGKSRGMGLEPGNLHLSPTQMEAALPALDLFPRWVLSLAVMEKLSVDDMSILLDQSPDMIRTGFAEAVRQVDAGVAAPLPGRSTTMGTLQHA